MKTALSVLAISLSMAAAAPAAILITEVHPTGSSTVTYTADWFELTNTGPDPVEIGGWKVDDSSRDPLLGRALRGVTSIAVGQSVIFAEGNADGSNDATIAANFKAAWFGANVPANFVIGGYGGSGIGLSSGGDDVNIYDGSNNVIVGLSFGTATVGVSFDNAAGIGSTVLQGPAISTLSAVGVNGAFASVTGGEVGSPGAIPEPTTAGLLAAGSILALRRRK